MNLEKISKIINLYDKPNQKRKIHLVPTPSIGGIIFVINLTIILLGNIFFNIFDFNLLSLFFYSVIIFFVALCDDILDFSHYKKFFFISFVVFLFFLFNKEKLISKIIFEFYYLSVENYLLSFFISWLCVMLFLNAINLYDGVNGQLAVYAIGIFIFFIYKNIFFDLSCLVLIFLFFFFISQFKRKNFFRG